MTQDAPSGAPRERVGFVGLGQIGRPMAKHLVDPVVFDVRAEATRGFADVATGVADLVARADVISVMVFDDAQVREVVGEMLPAASPGTVIAIHSTIAPGTAESLAAKGGDVHVVDAPVTGGPMGANAGTLVAMVGGDADVVERCRDAFGWASRVVHAGPVGAGTRLKLARNLITYVSFAGAAEAQRLAEAAGLDLIELGNVVRESDKATGGPGAIMFRDSTATASRTDPWHDVLVHTRDLGEKDLTLALALASDLGVDLPLTKIALERFASGLGVPHE